MSRRSEVTGPSYVYSERPPGFVFRQLRKGILRRRSDSILHCEGLPLPKLAERYGTPLYVYSATTIRERLESFESAFRDVPHTVCYSVKANSNLSILRLLARQGCGVDVVSGGEMERGRAGDRRPARKTVISGCRTTRDARASAATSGL